MVALRKESVDRNDVLLNYKEVLPWSLSARRAWIEIWDAHRVKVYNKESLSARRAWIEILESKQIDPSVMVALRKESVDRNLKVTPLSETIPRSLSARRAWIEIDAIAVQAANSSVSLSARRAWIEIVPALKLIACQNGRSPQGERG